MLELITAHILTRTHAHRHPPVMLDEASYAKEHHLLLQLRDGLLGSGHDLLGLGLARQEQAPGGHLAYAVAQLSRLLPISHISRQGHINGDSVIIQWQFSVDLVLINNISNSSL